MLNLTNNDSYLIFLGVIISNYFLINFLLNNLKIKQLIDFPNEERKIHKQPVQKIGGLILIINIIFFYFFNENLIIERTVLILLISIFLIGFFDDLFDLNPYLRLFFLIFFLYFFLLIDQTFLLNKIYFETFANFKNLSFLNTIVTILCIILLINAFNLFDGINGLSLSYFLIIFVYLLFKFNAYQLIFFISVCSILIYFNLKNKIFLGDSGVYILSTILGLKLIEIHNHNQFYFSSENIFILLMVPGIDMLRIFFERTINGKMFLTADNKHLHHYLLKKFGLSKTVFYLIIFLITPIIIYEINLIPAYLIILITISIYSAILIYLKKNEQNL